MRVFVPLGLVLLLSSCSETPTETKVKTPEKPAAPIPAQQALRYNSPRPEPPPETKVRTPEKPAAPITAQQAFRYTYPAARAWAGDSLPLRIRSITLTDVPAEPGEAAAWEITY